ncbi:MAG: hypothetical protein E6G21_03400 [Actinobacteria bacterium]|nr:MAG: hypothetical protein E6G21_03400 [Actinomycetota bacterium]
MTPTKESSYERAAHSAAASPSSTETMTAFSNRRVDETEGRLSMHSLRHSWVSALATSGLAAVTLARLAGHTDAGFTLRIYASDPRDDAAVAESVLSLAAEAGFGG